MSNDTFTPPAYSNKLGSYEIRRWYLQVQEVLANENWATSGDQYPQRKIVVGAAIRNRSGEDGFAAASDVLGNEFGKRLVKALAGQDAVGYGKAALVGQDGQSELGNVLLGQAFTSSVCHALGCSANAIPLTARRAGPGGTVDIPLVPTEDRSVDENYDVMTAMFEDAPAADEVVVLFAVMTGSRVRADLRKQ